MATVFERHIQNESEAAALIEHWGYPSRSFPCTNDAGSCEYLDGVYWMHDVSMLYTFIMWAVIGGLVVIWLISRALSPKRRKNVSQNGSENQIGNTPQRSIYRGWRAISASLRRRLLPEFRVRYFGHVTRLQVVILIVLLAYLLVFS
jgi:ferric-chelate reductase